MPQRGAELGCGGGLAPDGLDHPEQLHLLERLGDVVDRTQPHGCGGDPRVVEARDDDDGNIAP